MSTVLPRKPTGPEEATHRYERRPFPMDDIPDPSDLIDNDGVPLETDWHRLEITLLNDTVQQHMGERRDYFAGGNMFIYFSREQARNKDYRGPDFFFVKNTALEKPRRYWAVWEERGQYPDLIIELASPSTIKEDRTFKKEIYEKKFQTAEYFIYDPDNDVLEGYRLGQGGYEPKKPNEHGWLWCAELDLWLGKWSGSYLGKPYTYLRWYDADGTLIPTGEEAQSERAERERERAEVWSKRADDAEAELGRLRALLAARGEHKNGGA